MFISILFLYFTYGTTDYRLLKLAVFDDSIERLCWLAFFLSFAVKMPLLPFHI
jgi:NADH:ubiquinone oxidoreductase subunit 4 (subunit M)